MYSSVVGVWVFSLLWLKSLWIFSCMCFGEHKHLFPLDNYSRVISGSQGIFWIDTFSS